MVRTNKNKMGRNRATAWLTQQPTTAQQYPTIQFLLLLVVALVICKTVDAFHVAPQENILLPKNRQFLMQVTPEERFSVFCRSSRRRRRRHQSLLRMSSNGGNSPSSSSSPSSTAAISTARAGESGYSVLRQPAAWDTDNDPVFPIPESLHDNSNKNSNENMEEWWSSMRSGTGSSSGKRESSLVSNGKSYNSNKFRSDVNVNSIKNRDGDDDGNDTEQSDDDQELDLFQRSVNTLDFPRILKALYKECHTVPGKRIVQNAFTITAEVSTGNDHTKQQQQQQRMNTNNVIAQIQLQPLVADTVEGSQERYKAVQEMQWLLNGGDDKTALRIDDTITYKNRYHKKEPLYYRPPPIVNNNGFNLEGILEMSSTVQSKVYDHADVVDILDMINTMENVQLWCHTGISQITEYNFSQLPHIVSVIEVNTTLQNLLQTAFDTDMKLNGDTFPLLGSLRAKIRSLKSSVVSTLNNLITIPSMKSKLSLESGGALYSEVQGGRLVIPIDRKYASSIDGIVHDSSRSGKTIYVEPNEIVSTTNELRQIENELRIEETRIWRYITEQILWNRQSLEVATAAIGQLDAILARIQLGIKINGVIPVVQNEGVMMLQNAKHPVLLLRGIDNVVGSDITLGHANNQGLILTGPNAGGKTVILKLLGLMAFMARSGIPIPAESAARKSDVHNIDDTILNPTATTTSYQPRVDFFNPVLADIGDIQSVGGDLSTFSGHMLVCREVLQRSGKNALILMDELGSGTDPNQGVAIAQALLEAVIEEGARVAITTHYMQLKQLAASDDRFSVAGMQFVNGRPTFKLLPGQVGESFALSVAERLGLPSTVLDRANELLDSETRQMGDLLREMEAQKSLIDKQVEDLSLKQKEMEDMKLEMEQEMIRLENQQLNTRRIDARKFAKMLEEKEAILEDVLEKLKSDPSRRIVAKSWDDIKFVKRDALNEAENIPSVVARKQIAVAAMEEATADLIPIAEMRDKPDLNVGDKVMICQRGPMFAREATIVKAFDSRVEVKINNMNVSFKLTQVALVPSDKNLPLPKSQRTKNGLIYQQSSRSKAVEQALAFEGNTKTTVSRKYESRDENASSSTSGKVDMRTESNTIDVRGCNLMDAQEKIRDKFSMCLLNGRSNVFVLHGHGTGGVLKSKIRTWLKTEKLVKSYAAADRSDGGDAFTRVDLR